MKKPLELLVDELKTASELIPIGSNWKHYKGKIYAVEGFSVDCDTNEVLVSYYTDASTVLFSRKISSWIEEVSEGVKRFEKLETMGFLRVTAAQKAAIQELLAQ